MFVKSSAWDMLWRRAMYVCIHALYLYVYVHIIVYSPAVDASQ